MVAHTNLGAPQFATRLAHLQAARRGVAAACMSSVIVRAQAAAGQEGAVAA
jgi:hypothetical protein